MVMSSEEIVLKKCHTSITQCSASKHGRVSVKPLSLTNTDNDEEIFVPGQLKMTDNKDGNVDE